MKYLITIVLFVISIWFSPVNAQVNRYDKPATLNFSDTYTPLFSEETYLLAKAAYELKKEQQFVYYEEEAYKYLQGNHFEAFLIYAERALQTGYYNATLYYNMGVSYYLFGKKSKAKSFLKKAAREGLYPARSALYELKQKKALNETWLMKNLSN